MTKRTKKASKTEIAAIETQANEAVAMMAIESLTADPVLTSDDDAVLEVLEITAGTEVLEAEAIADTVLDLPATKSLADDTESFDDRLKRIDDADVDMGVFAVAKAFDERADYEAAKNPDNGNIQRTLKKARAQMATKGATRVLIAAGFDQGQINRVKHEGSRYNVYALGKLADVVAALNGGTVQNAVNNAVMRSMFKFRTADKAFTMDMAKAAVSDKIRVDAALKGILVRHTVSASTAPTQASSTMQALVDLGIAAKSGSEKNPTFTLTTTPMVAKIEEVLTKAA